MHKIKVKHELKNKIKTGYNVDVSIGTDNQNFKSVYWSKNKKEAEQYAEIIIKNHTKGNCYIYFYSPKKIIKVWSLFNNQKYLSYKNDNDLKNVKIILYLAAGISVVGLILLGIGIL